MDHAVREFVGGTHADVPTDVLSDILSGKIQLLALVRMLGESLTSEDDTVRSRAVTFLSVVVVHLASQNSAHTHEQLTRQTVRTLTIFFCEKLPDAAAIADAMARASNATAPIVPMTAAREMITEAERHAVAQSSMLADCLKAILALSAVGHEGNEAVSRNAFGGEEARTVAQTLFQTLELRVHAQPLRMLVCEILDSLVARNRAGLRAFPGGEPAFFAGYTRLVGGEKDPRNLLILFGIARVLLLEWHLDDASAEAMYNVLCCYFPITFRPPPDDPYHITPDDLKRALRACMSATPAFARLALPLLIEKLGAAGGATKVDTLQTLDACLPVYGTAAAMAHADAIWGLLKLDILQPTDEDSAACAQTTLSTLLRVVYQDTADVRGEAGAGLAQSVLDEACGELRSPGKTLAKMSMKLVQALISATPATAALALDNVLRLLLQLARDVSAEETGHVMELLAALLVLVCRGSVSGEGGTPGSEATLIVPLRPLHDELFATLTRGVEAHAHASALHGLVSLVQLPGFLTQEEIEYAARCVQHVLLDTPNDALRAEALQGLADMLKAHKHAIETQTVPFLLAQLPHERPTDLVRVRIALGALARLCVAPDLFERLCVRLFALLSAICEVQSNDAVDVGYACALLATLQVCLEAKIAAAHTDVPKYAASLPERLLHLLLPPICAGGQPMVAAALPVVQRASEMLAVVVPHIAAHHAQGLFDALPHWFQLPDGMPAAARAAVLDPSAPAMHSQLLAPCVAIVAALPRNVILPSDAWLDAALAWVLARDAAETQNAALEFQSVGFLVCALTNKYTADEEPALCRFWDALTTLPDERAAHALDVWVWAARGYLARGTAAGSAMLDRLQALLGDERLGLAAANAFRVLSVHDALLRRANGFQVRLLYKQRLLETLLPQLVAAYERAVPGSAMRTTCLVALATLLPALPHAALHARIVSLLPLLVHTLGIDDAGARTQAARALFVTLQSVPVAEAAESRSSAEATVAAIQTHLDTLVTHLVANVAPSPVTPPAARSASLQLLGALVPRLPHEALVPHRRRVIQELGILGRGVDDPRRSVRADAVDCRDVWYRVDVLA